VWPLKKVGRKFAQEGEKTTEHELSFGTCRINKREIFLKNVKKHA